MRNGEGYLARVGEATSADGIRMCQTSEEFGSGEGPSDVVRA